MGVLAVLATVGSPAQAQPAPLTVSHLHDLSDFAGTIPFSDVLLHADRSWDEIYATEGGTVRIFNAAGMEVYRFDKDWAAGSIFGLGVEESGDILLLLRDYTSSLEKPTWSLHRCDYRGEPLGRIEPQGLPAELASFSPDRMVLREGTLHLVDSSALQVAVLDTDGRFLRRHDLAGLLGIEEPEINDIFGFSLDRDGNMLFTIPVLFKVFIVSPDETVREFGTPGSSFGKFGVIAGVVADDDGNILVADKIRHVVTVFDPSFEPIVEIRSVRDRRDLVRPTGLAVGNAGRLYVTQARNRGVSVYSLTHVPGGLAGDTGRGQKGGASVDAGRLKGEETAPDGPAGTIARDPLKGSSSSERKRTGRISSIAGGI